MQGSVDLCYLKEDRLGTDPATCKSQVQRPTAEPPRNSLSLSVAGAVMMNSENWSAFHEVTGKRIVAPFRLTVATSFFVPPRSEVNKNYRCSSTVCTSNLFGQYRPINWLLWNDTVLHQPDSLSFYRKSGSRNHDGLLYKESKTTCNSISSQETLCLNVILLDTNLIFKISYLSHNGTGFFNCFDYQAAVLPQQIEYIHHIKR